MTDTRTPAPRASRTAAPPDFRALFEASPGPYLILAPDPPHFTIAAVNDAYLRATMTEREAIVGRALFDVFPDPPDDPTATGTRNLRASLERAMATQAPDRMAVQHYNIRRPDGTWEERHWSPINTPVLGRDGEVAHLIHHVEDVTTRVGMERELERLGLESLVREDQARVRERLLAEQTRLMGERDAEQRRLLTVLEQSPLAILVAEAPSGRLVFANRQVHLILGASPLSEGIDRYGEEWRGLHLADGRPLAPSEWPLARAVERGEVISDEVLRVRRSDGAHVEIAVNAAPVRDAEGRIIAGVAIFWDVTERRRAEEALRHARREAEAASRAKSDFLAVMSHELRTPLNAIGGYVELLELGIRGPVTDEQVTDLRRVQQAQRHLIGLINDVLNYVRIETGRVQYAMADVPLHDSLAAMETLVQPPLAGKGLRYAYVSCDPSLTVYADPEKLKQILVNLLTNALKFTDAGGDIRLECDPGPGEVHIRVRDTGRGISPDKRETIFEPFVQVDAGLTRTTEGVGLGLAISRDLARGMGGDLTVESAVGEGSTFTLTLPKTTARDDRTNARAG